MVMSVGDGSVSYNMRGLMSSRNYSSGEVAVARNGRSNPRCVGVHADTVTSPHDFASPYPRPFRSKRRRGYYRGKRKKAGRLT